jgi:hypothetical protein
MLWRGFWFGVGLLLAPSVVPRSAGLFLPPVAGGVASAKTAPAKSLTFWRRRFCFIILRLSNEDSLVALAQDEMYSWTRMSSVARSLSYNLSCHAANLSRTEMAPADSIHSEKPLRLSWIGQPSSYKKPCTHPKCRTCWEHPNTDPAALGRSFIAFFMSAPSTPLPSVEVRCQASWEAESAMSPGAGE